MNKSTQIITVIASIFLCNGSLTAVEARIATDVASKLPEVCNHQDRASLEKFLGDNIKSVAPETLALISAFAAKNPSNLTEARAGIVARTHVMID